MLTVVLMLSGSSRVASCGATEKAYMTYVRQTMSLLVSALLCSLYRALNPLLTLRRECWTDQSDCCFRTMSTKRA